MTVTIGLAFLAGLASFLSPCVFSLVPAYISYLSGRSLASIRLDPSKANKWETFSHGIAFVLGFSIVFIALGVAFSAIGSVLYDLRFWLAKIGGLVVIIFGLHLTGIFRLQFLEYDIRPQSSSEKSRSYLSSALMGVFFSAGWSPCVGPVLSTILTLAINGGSITEGVKLLSAYSAGLAIPFLFAALGIGWVTTIIQKYGKAMHYVEVVMGVILIIVGGMLFFGVLERLNQFGFFINFGI
ncbi:MAG: cytochrome c biogenesis protein CcdA [Anaerolineaceae bacterium]|nr:cytochrome c biogenesis protein CcdA [Anaerolineaceae bacterium]